MIDQKMFDTFNAELAGIKLECAPQMQTMFQNLWNRFANCPASTKFHSAYEGGLLEHSLLVLQNLRTLNVNLGAQLDDSELVLVAFCHDLGKIGNASEPLYIKLDKPKWDGSVWAYNKNIPSKHEVLSLFWLQSFFVRITESQLQAILYHNGQYVDSGKDVQWKETDLTMLLHWADMWASRNEVR